MKGYKAFTKDLSCRDVKYKVGEEYYINDEPVPCAVGFHFCKNIADVYKYYPRCDDTRICEVDATGDIRTDDNIKFCTNKIKIIKEITDKHIKHCNINETNTGFQNTGDRNTGNWNTGDWNTGDWNIGYLNTGDRNIGDRNTGDWNTGNRNTGNWNTGNWNTGDWNTGDQNTGDWNITDNSSGCFCTEPDKTIELFDKPSNMTHAEWRMSNAKHILAKKPTVVYEWVRVDDMTDEEKEKYPEHKITGGYLKMYDESESSQIWWDGLSDGEKDEVMSLPNFDADKFYECTGIRV